MQLQPQTEQELCFPQKISLSEEELFLQQIRNGEIALFSNEEVLAELAQTLGLK